MKGSSKKTMLTAAVLMALSSATASAATSGTVDSQELFRSNRLVTDHAQQPNVEEAAAEDSYSASISEQKKPAAAPVKKSAESAAPQRLAPLHWDNVDARIAARNESPAFTLAAQKAKPVIITAADVKREERRAEKEGREPEQLVGKTNNIRGEGLPYVQVVPQNEQPRVMPPRPPVPAPPDMGMQPSRNQQPALPAAESVKSIQPPAPPMTQHTASERQMGTPTENKVFDAEQRPQRPAASPRLPREAFSLTAPADAPAPAKRPDQFDTLSVSPQSAVHAPEKTIQPVPEHSIRPEGVPEFHSDPGAYPPDEGLNGISDEVRRHILAGQLAMEIQLKKDPTVGGMRALTHVLRENTTLKRLQKIDFLIGFGRALHRSGLPRQQQALLIKTVADSF